MAIVALLCTAALAGLVRLVFGGVAGEPRSVAARAFGGAYVLVGSVAVCSPPGPLPPSIGLDASWTLALARAASAHLVFGRDIIFTYGPLGYLVTAIADRGAFPAMLALQVAVAALILAAIVERLREPATVFQKVLLATFAPVALANSPIDLWVPFLILLLLVRRAGARNEMALMLGAGLLSGVFALTKFTVAIDVALVAGSFFAVRLWEERAHQGARLAVLASAATFACGALVASTATFVAVDDGLWAALLLEAPALGAMLAVIWRRREGARRRRALLPMTAALVFLAVAVALSPSYRSFLSTSLELAIGYSAAHGLEGPRWQVAGALLFVSALAVAVWPRPGGASAAVACAAIVYEWTQFKLGFVRQDLHVLYFYGGSIFAALVAVYSVRSRRGALAGGIVLAAAVAMFASERASAGMPGLLQPLSAPEVARKFDAIEHIRGVAESIDAADVENIRADLLPARTLRAIGSRPVDVVPAETAYAFAGKLHWEPEPAFESSLAFSPVLDQLNLRSLGRRHGDAILYTFGTIDGRYPVGDEPLTFRYTLCNYGADLAGSDPERDVLLLLHAGESRCLPATTGSATPVIWNEPVAVPRGAGRLTFARVRIEPNLAGRLLSAAFREPFVRVTVSYDDGSTLDYRLVVANAAEGLLVDPLPRDGAELANLFAGRLRTGATSLTFHADPRWFEGASIAFDSVAFAGDAPPLRPLTR